MRGVELAKDRKIKEPAKDESAQVLERAKELGLLIGKAGLYGNVLCIKPPMCFTREDVDFLISRIGAPSMIVSLCAGFIEISTCGMNWERS